MIKPFLKILFKLLIVIFVISLLDFLPPTKTTRFFLSLLIILLITTGISIFLAIAQEFGIFAKSKDPKGSASPYLKVKYKDIEVSYTWPLNGGGIFLVYELIRILEKRAGKVDHIYEYCSGPGFVGFALLAHHLCDRLTLSDLNPEAIKAAQETIKNNHLENKVTVYQSDCLDQIPCHEQWDCVVAVPPWFMSKGKKGGRIGEKVNKTCDIGGQVHKKFYQDIGKFLKPDGDVLFVESGEYTALKDFKGMIESNGLTIVESYKAVSLLNFFKNINEYKGLKLRLAIFLRLMLFFREVYFIWTKKAIISKNPSIQEISSV